MEENPLLLKYSLKLEGIHCKAEQAGDNRTEYIPKHKRNEIC